MITYILAISIPVYIMYNIQYFYSYITLCVCVCVIPPCSLREKDASLPSTTSNSGLGTPNRQPNTTALEWDSSLLHTEAWKPVNGMLYPMLCDKTRYSSLNIHCEVHMCMYVHMHLL